MDAASYTSLTRQSGLMREMSVVANNIANSDTTGFRREGIVFTEYVTPLVGQPSLSMAHGNARSIDLSQASLTQTGAAFDFAIEGEGFFLVDDGRTQYLTRAGAFTPSADGSLVNADGHRLLDEGGSPVQVPPGARAVVLATDGTLTADGTPIARLGLWQPANPTTLQRQAGTLFAAENVEPLENGRIRQGALEGSNVNPVTEIARMIEVQRAYELGQSFLDQEDQRQRAALETLSR